MTPLERAEAAYQEALREPSEAVWATAARLLYGVRRKARLPPRSAVKSRYPFPVAEATFADGRTLSMTFWSQHGKPLDWERAKRVCASGYKLLHGDYAMSDIVHIREKISGETWSPAA